MEQHSRSHTGDNEQYTDVPDGARFLEMFGYDPGLADMEITVMRTVDEQQVQQTILGRQFLAVCGPKAQALLEGAYALPPDHPMRQLFVSRFRPHLDAMFGPLLGQGPDTSSPR